MENTTTLNAFERTIKEYLDNKAKNDELFAPFYAKEGKSIKDCCNYIISEVQKDGAPGYPDEVIYGWAVHYYEEDDLKAEGAPQNARVVVNHTVELTEEEKAELKAKAMEEYKERTIRELKSKAQRTISTPKAQSEDQLSMF